MLLRQTLLYLPAQLVGPLFQFVSIIAWTHFLTPGNMGVFALITAAQELAYTATLYWFTIYTVRYHDAGSTPEQRRRFLNTETAMFLASAAGTTLIVAGLVFVVEAHWTPSLILATLAQIVTRAAVTQLTDRARAEHDTMAYTALQTIWPVLGLALGMLLVAIFEPSVAMVLWGYTLAQIVSLVVAGWRLQLGWRPFEYDREMLRVSLRYGIPLLFGSLFIWVAVNGIRFVVEFTSGAAAVGLITVGWMLGYRAAMFAAMLVTAAAFPLAVKASREIDMNAGQQQLERNGVLLLIALLPAAAGLWLVAKPLVALVVAEPYREMTVTILPMSILAGVFRTIRIHFGEQVFLLREQTTIPLVNDMIDAGLAIVGVVAGLAIAGLAGSVIGAAVGALVCLFVTLGTGWRLHRYAMPPTDIIKVVGATAIMVLAVRQISIGPGISGITIAAAAGVAVYGASLALLYPQVWRHIGALVKARAALRGR